MLGTRPLASGTVSTLIVLLAGCATTPCNRTAGEDREREVKEAGVPKAALATLKTLADKATITEFAEEIEHGHRF